jgi:ABC-type antimicrobial peptide transport system permease subunit
VALGSLRQNKLRTALTLIGIIVGVTAVIAVVTIIKGLDQTVAQTFSSQGSTVFHRLEAAAGHYLPRRLHQIQQAEGRHS